MPRDVVQSVFGEPFADLREFIQQIHCMDQHTARQDTLRHVFLSNSVPVRLDLAPSNVRSAFYAPDATPWSSDVASSSFMLRLKRSIAPCIIVCERSTRARADGSRSAMRRSTMHDCDVHNDRGWVATPPLSIFPGRVLLGRPHGLPLQVPSFRGWLELVLEIMPHFIRSELYGCFPGSWFFDLPRRCFARCELHHKAHAYEDPEGAILLHATLPGHVVLSCLSRP